MIVAFPHKVTIETVPEIISSTPEWANLMSPIRCSTSHATRRYLLAAGSCYRFRNNKVADFSSNCATWLYRFASIWFSVLFICTIISWDKVKLSPWHQLEYCKILYLVKNFFLWRIGSREMSLGEIFELASSNYTFYITRSGATLINT